MKFHFTFFLILLLAFYFVPSASAQRFIGGVAAGMNCSMVDGDEVFETYTKIGFNGGPYVKLVLDKKQRFSVTMELLFVQKGGRKKYPVYPDTLFAKDDTLLIDPGYEYDTKFFYKLRTDYLEIPLLVHFEDPGSKFGIGLGFAWARLVYIKEIQHDFRKSDSLRGAARLNTKVSSGRYNKNDWSFIADVKIPIFKGLKFNFRFQYSLTPFGKVRYFYAQSDNIGGVKKRWPYHNTLTFRIIYSFNEKYTENHNYNWEGDRIGPKWIRDPDAMKW